MALTLRLTEEQDRLLTELAATERRSKNEIVIMAIEEKAARDDKSARVRAAFDYVIERDAGILAKLADA